MVDDQTSAVDVMYDVIAAATPGIDGWMFIGHTPDKEGLIRELNEGVDAGTYKATFAPGIAIERPVVEVGVRGLPQDYSTPRNEALRLRRLITKATNITLNDVTILHFQPIGGIIYMGRDEKRRVQFALRFEAWMELNHGD